MTRSQLNSAVRTHETKFCFGSRARARRADWAGFTLLELMLALALTAILLVLVNMAIDLHLRSLDSRRKQLEESQLARSILRLIADDIRASVQAYQQDVSGVESMLQEAATAAVNQAASDLGGAISGGSGGSGGGGGQGGGSPSTSQQGGGSGGSSGGFGGSGSTGFDTSGLDLGSMTSTSTPATSDLSDVSVQQLPGIYGNQYQLQIDVSRLPRVDQYQQYLSDNPVVTMVDIPSDVKTVTYYVKTATDATAMNTPVTGTLNDLTNPMANATGLVRRELDRAITTNALETGNITGLEYSGELIAPEVVGLEFRYCNGVEWLTEWDTSVEQTMPIAIQILLVMTTTTGGVQSQVAATAEGLPANMRIYSMVVSLPTGGQPAGDGSSATGTGDLSGSSSTGSTSGSTTGGTP